MVRGRTLEEMEEKVMDFNFKQALAWYARLSKSAVFRATRDC